MASKSIFVGILFLLVFRSSFAEEFAQKETTKLTAIPTSHLRYDAIGSAYETLQAGVPPASPVWFTVFGKTPGAVYYPTPEHAVVQGLEFVITDGKSLFLDQKHDAQTLLKYGNGEQGPLLGIGHPMGIHLVGQSKLGLYQFEEKMVSDPKSPTVRIKMTFHWPDFGKGYEPGEKRPLRLLVVLKGVTRSKASGVPDVFPALAGSKPILQVSGEAIPYPFPGDSIIGELPVERTSTNVFDLALSFGKSSAEATTLAEWSLQTPFEEVEDNYERGWVNYLNLIQSSQMVTQRMLTESSEIARSAVLLKMLENKTHPGALVSHLGANSVSPKQIYQQAVGLLAAGDSSTAMRSLSFLREIQNSNGSYSPKYSLEGLPLFAARQYEQTAYPILLFKKLESYEKLKASFKEFFADQGWIHAALEFLAKRGPLTPEDLDGQKGGYVPSALAAMCSAFKWSPEIASEFAVGTNPIAPQQWESFYEKWLLDPQGKYQQTGVSRLGFLDWARMKLREPKDPRIVATLNSYLESPLNPGLTHSRLFSRNESDLSPSGQKVWPELSAELGLYWIMAEQTEAARQNLEGLFGSLNEMQMLPQSLWISKAGLSVSPEAIRPWLPAHALTLLLYRSLQEGFNFDSPKYPFSPPSP